MKKIILNIFVILICINMIQNNIILTKHFDLLDTDIRIVQITDLHTKEFGVNNSKLIKKISSLNPDVITITGDIIDGSNMDLIYIVTIVRELSDIAPVLYVLGNNDMWTLKSLEIIEAVELGGGTFLDNNLISIKNVSFYGHNPYRRYSSFISDLSKYSKSEEELVLLTHQPEYVDLLDDVTIDLVLSGHTHGGQIRLPLIGALVVPDQNGVPKYDKGLYVKDNLNLIVSSGLGNSIIPIRVFNPPEIILIT
jgi:predicted MPP superfamily phosphohydrolase